MAPKDMRAALSHAQIITSPNGPEHVDAGELDMAEALIESANQLATVTRQLEDARAVLADIAKYEGKFGHYEAGLALARLTKGPARPPHTLWEDH